MIRHLGRAHLTYAALLALTYLLGFGAITLTSRGLAVSAWWPAAGTAVLALLALPRRFDVPAALGVWVTTAAANVLADRPLALAMVYGFANALEAWTVARLLRRDDPRPVIAGSADVRRLLFAASAGAVLIASVAALGAWVLEGASFWEVLLAAAPSHGAAVITIVPAGLAPRGPRRAPQRIPIQTQPLALALSVAIAFSPFSHLPLAFLPMPFLVWGAYAFRIRGVAIELVLVAAAAALMTAFGGGPFATELLDAGERVVVLQLFLFTYASSVLFIAAAQLERLRLAARLIEREQLLRGGILDAQVGLAVLRVSRLGVPEMVEANELADQLIGPVLSGARRGREPGAVPEPADVDWWSSPLGRAVDVALRSSEGEWRGRVGPADGAPVIDLVVVTSRADDGAIVVTVQAIDVTERWAVERALESALADERRAAQRLEDLNRERDEFIGAVSHELRTPITSILGFTEILTDQFEGDSDSRVLLSVVQRNARRLNGLVEDLLQLAGPRRGGLRGAAKCDAQLVAEQVVEELKPIADAAQVRLRCAPGSTMVVGVGQGHLVRMITNLVTNAVKFTPGGGLVSVSARREDRWAVVRVVDTGSGVPPHELEHVFERFYRSETAVRGAVPGIGLGLAMVRELATENGGAVHLESDGTSGTTAVLRLPLADAGTRGEEERALGRRPGRATPAALTDVAVRPGGQESAQLDRSPQGYAATGGPGRTDALSTGTSPEPPPPA